MSVPTDFLSRFCQAPVASQPVGYTNQDVIDDFCAYIQKCSSNSKSSTILIRYAMPEKFTNTFTKYDFFSIISSVLIEQMGCNFARKHLCFSFQTDTMSHKSFYFIKLIQSSHHGEYFFVDEWCELYNNPDEIIIKLYVPRQ